MPWPGGRRIPESTRQHVLRRDRGICYLCGQPGATQVDHKTPHHQGGTDHPDNLGAIHARPCHLNKTLAEAQAARALPPRTRPPEAHPGATPCPT